MKKSEFEALIDLLRMRLTPRDEHHPCCASTGSVGDVGTCDCYARRDHEDHRRLDRLVELNKNKEKV